MSVQPVLQQPYGQGFGVVVQQPAIGQQKTVSSRDGHRTWTYDLMDCCSDDTSCFLNCFCPCIAMYEIAVRLQENPLVPFCVPGGTILLRTRTRSLGGIQGGILGDCCTVCCFFSCALGQMERELRVMGW